MRISDWSSDVCSSDLSDCRDVGHLEGQRSRRLEKDGASVRPDLGDDVAADAWVEIGDLDTHGRQNIVTKAARRSIDGVDDQQMIARRQERRQAAREDRKSVV